MDRMIYVAASGVRSTMQRQEVLANNLANANTPGFRAETVAFRVAPVTGPGLPTRAFVAESTPGADFTPGVITTTGRPLDVAVQGLSPLGGNLWSRSFASGDPTVGASGTANFGALQSGSLEESNTDLTGELVNMITAQRVYQANAQTIKTQDQVLQTLVNLR